GDCTIDPAIVMQLLGPILSQRVADGTAIFDAPGDPSMRSTESPEELLMICVDSSGSMDDTADFDDVEEEYDDSTPSEATQLLEELRPNDSPSVMPAPLETVREYILNHGSFEDIISSAVKAPDYRKGSTANFLVSVIIEEVATDLRRLMTQLNNIH